MEDDRIEEEEQSTYHSALDIPEAEEEDGEEVEQQVAILRPPQRREHRSNSAPPLFTNARGNFAEPFDLLSHWLGFVVIVLLFIIAVAVVEFHVRRGSFRGTETFKPILDALYFTVVTLCTTGYGDIVPDTTFTKLFTCALIFVSVGFIHILLNELLTHIRKMIDKATERMRMRIRMKLLLVSGVCIAVGTITVHYVEKLDWVDSFYLAVTSSTTVGYGDFAFTTIPGRWFAIIWLLVSTFAVARAISYLSELWINNRNRRIARWVLQRNMRLGDFVAADLDKDGTIRKSEFVIHKLKEMGKIEEKDILQICQRFDSLEINNCGKITLAGLMGHPDFVSS